MPEKTPRRSQYGSPSSQKANDSTELTNVIITQLAAHEGTELRVDQIPGVPDHLPPLSGASTRTSAWARRFSKIQYAATANVKKKPTRISSAVRP